MWPWLVATGVAKAGQYYLGQRALSKPTPWKPQWDSPENIALRADWEKGMQKRLAEAKGAGMEDITQAMASRGILSSGIVAGEVGKLGADVEAKGSIERQAFLTDLRSQYLQHLRAWQATERARMLAKDKLSMDLLGDIAGALGITAMKNWEFGEWGKLLKGSGKDVSFQMPGPGSGEGNWNPEWFSDLG